MILSLKADLVGASSMRMRLIPHSQYQNKYLAPFPNGVYAGRNYWSDPHEPISEIFYLSPGTVANGSIFVEDAGDWAAFESGVVPVGMAEDNDAQNAKRLQYTWTAPVTITPIRGDSQISSVTVTGAKRGVNVFKTNKPTRGKLHYQIITADSGDYIVRWWCGTQLVAEGSRTGNGALTCSAVNDSGLTITCTLTYAADVAPGTAFIELRWPETYQIHYSTSALSFPRSPEATVSDKGEDDFVFLTDVLAAGTYNCNVLPVDDGGTVQAASFPTDLVRTINNPPAAPTITGITGNAAALTAAWSVGESGCTFTVYASPVNYPVNYGNYASPAPIATALNATSQVLAAVTGYPGKVRVVVRATKDGVQETKDTIFEVELDAAGDIVPPRPNRASIENIAITSGRTIAVDAVVLDDDARVAATIVDLYVVALASSINLASPQASENLDAAVIGVQRKTVSYAVGANGWYRVAVVARSAAGARSRFYSEYILYIDNTAPSSVSNFGVKVIRGK